jgi:quercetin dioxygenase-like cupin family protein
MDRGLIERSRSVGYYTRGERPEYFPIHVGELAGEKELTVLNLPELADLIESGEGATVEVHGAPAQGVPLLTNGHLGADMLYVAPGDSFPLHVHGGHHFLFCVKGAGTVTFDGKQFAITPGDLYMIEASIPHAVGADPDGPGHWLVAFGAPHTMLESEHRMGLVDDEDEHAVRR